MFRYFPSSLPKVEHQAGDVWTDVCFFRAAAVQSDRPWSSGGANWVQRRRGIIFTLFHAVFDTCTLKHTHTHTAQIPMLLITTQLIENITAPVGGRDGKCRYGKIDFLFFLKKQKSQYTVIDSQVVCLIKRTVLQSEISPTPPLCRWRQTDTSSNPEEHSGVSQREQNWHNTPWLLVCCPLLRVEDAVGLNCGCTRSCGLQMWLKYAFA